MTLLAGAVVAPQSGNNKRAGGNLVAPTLPNKKGKGKAKTNATNAGTTLTTTNTALPPGIWKDTAKITKSGISITLAALQCFLRARIAFLKITSLASTEQ